MIKGQPPTDLERATDQQYERWKEQVFTEPIPTPQVVDWEVTGVCPYRCEWCWGQDRSVGSGDSMSLREVKRAMELMALGTMSNQRFVITGGEPTTRKDIAEIVGASVLTADHTVLSTTGDTLAATTSSSGLWKAIEAAQEKCTIAVPLHATDASMSSRVMPALRVNHPRNRVDIATAVLGRAQDIGANTTLRTTVTSLQSLRDIDRIAQVLLESGVDTTRLRWKLYEYNPYVGPRASQGVSERYQTSSERFTEIVSEIQVLYDGLFAQIDWHGWRSSIDNYVIVGPDGYIRVIEEDPDGTPRERYLRDFAHGVLVNIRHNPIVALEAVTEHMPLSLWNPEFILEEGGGA